MIENGALANDPFVLIDVGCGMGIDPLWRLFEPYLVAHGLDPQIAEVARLRREETNPAVAYHASLVGLPNDHDFHRRRVAARAAQSPYFDPMARSSGTYAAAQEIDAGRRSLSELNTWNAEELTENKKTLSEFIASERIQGVDFVKTDTDGSDYEVLISAAGSIREAGILGFMVEASFNTQPNDTENSLANVDRLLREHGFLLYTLSVNRYSRAALPAPFAVTVLAQTTSGQAMWGDLVYLRDAGSDHYTDVWGEELSPTKLLKLACLYELFRLPDCAAELLLSHRQVLEPLVDVNRGLDLLTPPLRGNRVRHEEYVAAFQRDPYSFYPSTPRLLGLLTMTRRLAGRLLRSSPLRSLLPPRPND